MPRLLCTFKTHITGLQLSDRPGWPWRGPRAWPGGPPARLHRSVVRVCCAVLGAPRASLCTMDVLSLQVCCCRCCCCVAWTTYPCACCCVPHAGGASGRVVQSLQEATHAVLRHQQQPAYLEAVELGTVSVVAPDWVLSSVQRQQRPPEGGVLAGPCIPGFADTVREVTVTGIQVGAHTRGMMARHATAQPRKRQRLDRHAAAVGQQHAAARRTRFTEATHPIAECVTIAGPLCAEPRLPLRACWPRLQRRARRAR